MLFKSPGKSSHTKSILMIIHQNYDAQQHKSHKCFSDLCSPPFIYCNYPFRRISIHIFKRQIFLKHEMCVLKFVLENTKKEK